MNQTDVTVWGVRFFCKEKKNTLSRYPSIIIAILLQLPTCFGSWPDY